MFPCTVKFWSLKTSPTNFQVAQEVVVGQSEKEIREIFFMERFVQPWQQSPHPWREFKSTWMWHLGTWLALAVLGGWLGSSIHFQPKWFCDCSFLFLFIPLFSFHSGLRCLSLNFQPVGLENLDACGRKGLRTHFAILLWLWGCWQGTSPKFNIPAPDNGTAH